MVNSLVEGNSLFEDIIYPLFFAPLQIPWSPLVLLPFSQAQSFMDTIAESCFENKSGAESNLVYKWFVYSYGGTILRISSDMAPNNAV